MSSDPSIVERSPRLLLELGRIAARWSSLDHLLVKLLTEILQDDAIAEAMYFTVSSQRARFDMVRTVVSASRHGQKADINSIMEE